MRDNAQYPRARLDLYEEAVVLTRYEGGGRHTSYPVAVDDVVAAFSRVPVSSGLLPKNCLFWGRENGEMQMAVYVPGRRRYPLSFSTAPRPTSTPTASSARVAPLSRPSPARPSRKL